MIVIGIDPHMKTHTAVALDAATGRIVGEKTVSAGVAGRDELMVWASTLDAQRYFALEDCRHVSGSLERHLLGQGERVVRVPPKLMAGARRSARCRGKSDPIDAACVARAALREPSLPEASVSGPASDVRQLADHRDDLVAERKRIIKRLRWNCHDLELALDLPPRVLDRHKWLLRLETALEALPPSVRRRVALDQLRHVCQLTTEIRALERELAQMVRKLAPELLEIPGCSALSAASLIGRAQGASRFGGDAAFAMHTGTAPLPVSSGNSNRHRLNRRGDRHLNCTIHMIALTQARMHPPAMTYMARKRAAGMSYREALRCLKRHLVRVVFKTMVRAERGEAGRVVTVRFRADDVAIAV